MAINGQPAKGTASWRGHILGFSPTPTVDFAISDTQRTSLRYWTFDILKADSGQWEGWQNNLTMCRDPSGSVTPPAGLFAPVSGFGLSNQLLVVPVDSPLKNLAELIAQAKAAPGKLFYAHGAMPAQIAAEVNDLASRARADRLTMDEIQGGTFSISNAGVYGAISSAPVINVPEVGIVTMEAITKRAVVVSTADGDTIDQGLYGANATNFLTITGSARAGDTSYGVMVTPSWASTPTSARARVR